MMTDAEKRKFDVAVKAAETANALAERYRREILRLGVTTNSRETFMDVCRLFKAKSADELLAMARRAGVTQ